MRDLTAQVTSGLLRFPEVTTDALGEDEVTLDSVLQGKFTVGRSGLSWLACGPQLEVVHAVTGERFSAYRFSGVSEHPPSVLAIRDFCWLKRTGLLVGLEEAEGSMLCLYDLGISRVVKAVVIPGRITAIEPLVSYGGASASTQHLHQSLRWFFGVAAVVTDVGHVLLVDLCLDDLSCSQSELEASDLEVVSKSSPSEIPRFREGASQQGRHLCLQLSSPTGTGATALQYIQRTNQLAVGFSDGHLHLWNMKSLKKEYQSLLEGGRVPVYAFTFQEPENDPRNCCYLWAVQSAQDLEGDVVSLHLLQLAFGERKCLASGKILYEGLEYCEERYSQELNTAAFPLRAQATNTRLISCQTVEKFRPHPDRDDSVNEVASPDTSVSIFSWQVKSYGQSQPSTFIAIFDINRWYHAQMPDSLRAGESLRNCPYLAVWSLDSVVEVSSSCPLMDIVVHERSLSRGLPYTSPPPEQFFNPNTFNFDGSCLLNAGIVHFTCHGHQKETLSFLKKVAPGLSDSVSSGYSRCLMSGLLSSRLADVQPSSLSQEEQLDAILCTAVETSSLALITGCIKQWTTEEQPGSAVNLRYILEWAWNKVIHTKEELDEICAPLFDSSTNFTDPQTLQLLQHSQRLLANLSAIFQCLLNDAQELTQKGLVGLMNKCMVSSLISQYAQVVLWFCRTGLLPEGTDDDVLQISRPFYSHTVIKNYYTGQREELRRLAKDQWCADCLMIDGLVGQFGERLAELWKRDEGGTGEYPPPSLHALLDIYLLENVEESAKHAIVIYLLLDVMYSFPNKSGASVESFPTAFAIPIGLVKLVQGLWLLDHHDHESSLELLLHPSSSHSVFGWQHERVLQALMCQQKHSGALRYLHAMKPPIHNSGQVKLSLSVLLHNRCILEAWAVIRQHCNKLNMEELMRFFFETCQQLDLMKDLLKLPLGSAEQECLERFLQNSGGFQNRELLMVHYLQQANYVPALQLNQTLKMNLAIDRDPKMKERSNTRNSILNQYGKVLPRVQRKLAIERAKPYQHPTIHREVKRPQPLSTVVKRSASENVMTRAAFINNVLSKIQEVWVGKNQTPESSPFKSPKESETQVPSLHPPSPNLPEPFVGTPMNMLTKRMSRLLDLVVQPSSQNSPESSNVLGTPSRSITSWAGPKSVCKASELSLLQTPQVVKRARALASGPVFSAFTPQSILRSSLRPTPVATPSASPGRSITPPLRPKESRITFIEEPDSPEVTKGHWNNGIAISRVISTSKRSSPPPKTNVEAWSEHSDEGDEDKDLRTYTPLVNERENPDVESESGSSGKEVPAEKFKQVLPSLVQRASLGQEASFGSNQSDTTLEFHDAPSPEDLLEIQNKHRADDGMDREVTVRPSRTLEEDLTSAESSSRAEPEKELSADQENLSSQQSLLNTQKYWNQSLELEMNSNMENDLPKEVTEQQEPSDTVVHKPNVVMETEVAPTLENLAEVSVPFEIQELKEAEEWLVTSSVVAETANIKPVEENVTPNTSEEPVTEESEPVPQELVSQASVVSEPPAIELVSSEPVADAAVHTYITGEYENNEECEEKSMETSDLDAFVEQHLFGPDLSPPLTRSSIRESSEASLRSEPIGDVKEIQCASENAGDLKTQTSVASSEPATSESRSVVSVNDSEEEEEESEDEKSEDEKLEDSGSEVEIIEEVKGDGRSHQQSAPALYLEDLPPHEQYLQEQANAVLSLVTPEAHLKVLDEGNGEVLMVGLRPADLDEEGAMCYTELKPSTTILVPVELAEEHQRHLMDGSLQTLNNPSDEAHPEDCENFTLMLDPDVEEMPVTSELISGNDLLPLREQEQPNDNLNQLNSEVAVFEQAVEVPANKLEQMSNTESPATEVPELEVEQPDKPADVHCGQILEPIATPESESSHQDTKRLSNGDKLVSASFEMQEQVLESSPLENVLTSQELLGNVSALDVEKTIAEDNITSQGKNAPSLAEENENLSKIKETVRPKSPARSKSPARTKVERSAESNTDVLEATKEVPRSPSRRGRKTVTFPVSNPDAEKDLTEEDQIDSQIPSTPRRITRSGKQLQDQVSVTPRRSTRKADAAQQGKDDDRDMPSTKVSTPSSPQKTPQKATPRKGSRRTRSTTVDEDEAVPTDLLANDDSQPQVRQSARKARQTIVEVPETLQEVLEEKEQSSKARNSPSRVTRKSTRGLALESFQQELPEVAPEVTLNQPLLTPPRSRRKTMVSTTEKNSNVTFVIDDAELQSVSRRLTRSQHWNQLEVSGKEKDLIPLEVGAEVPQAGAFEERLNDGKAEESVPVVNEIVRAKRRTTRSAAPAAVEESKIVESDEMQEPVIKSSRRTRATKMSEQTTSSVADPVTSTADLKRTRGRKNGTTLQNDAEVPEMLLPPSTPQIHASEDAVEFHSKEDNVLVDVALEPEAVKLRKKRTTRTKAAPEPPPPVEISFLSPMASPAEPIAGAERRTEDKETPSLKMNLRRKRMMDAIFPKPVTRRKKL